MKLLSYFILGMALFLYNQNSHAMSETDDACEISEAISEAEKQAVENRMKEVLYQGDKVYYNQVLKVISKLLRPSLHKLRGGNKSLIASLELMDELLRIHKNEVYGSAEKIARLEELIHTAKGIYSNTRKLPRERVDADLSTKKYEPELASFIQTMSLETIDTLGMNITVSPILGVQGGICFGRSISSYGCRHVVIGGNVGMAALPYIAATIERAKFNKRVNIGGGVKIGLGPGGGISDGGPGDISSTELGICILGGVVERVIKVWGLSRLLDDLKYFRKNIGLVPESGVLPKYNP